MKKKVDCHNCIYYRMCEFVHEFYEAECDDFQNKADFVEVVRCKDCENYVPLGDEYVFKGKKAMHCWLRASCTGDNYYCADGIRKDVTDINVGDKKGVRVHGGKGLL